MTQRDTARRIVRDWPDGPPWPAALAAMLARTSADDCPLVLDSARTGGPWGRFSYLAIRPARRLVVDPDGGATLTAATPAEPAATVPADSPDAVLQLLREQLGDIAVAPAAEPDGRFIGGWAGVVGYEFGAGCDGVPPAGADPAAMPRLALALYDVVACYDHHAGRWELSALTWPDRLPAERRLDELQRRLDELQRRLTPGPSAGSPSPASSPPPSPSADWGVSPPATDWLASADCNFSRDRYEQAIRRAKQYIAAGDIYQVNLSQCFSWPASAGPIELFARLRQSHPSWYAGLLCWPDAAGAAQGVCSASPELLFSLRGGHVLTRPIKGTRPRGRDEAADRAAVAELLSSEKDAAELAMIVDLARNDVGRVCRPGSVRVVQPRDVESHRHVHHTVATVAGELADGRDAVDLLRAIFPGGSITGAPKIRAMQIIAELEPTARSAYTGGIGYFGADGSAMFNIAIRTAIVSGGRVFLQVGGGIVADSQPADEYAETLAKAQGLAQAAAGSAGENPAAWPAR